MLAASAYSDSSREAAIEAMLPTPTARDWRSGQASGATMAKNARPLSEVIETALLPTPTARLGDGTSRGASHPDRRRELCSKRGGELDEIAVHVLLPTPTAMDSHSSGGSTPSDVTLTDAIVRTDLGRRPNPRHGAPTPQPSPDGSTS